MKALSRFFLLSFAIFFGNVKCNNILLQEVEGYVGNENYTYYRLAYGGNLLLELETIEGDTDIYINNRNVMPTYNPETYDFHSATCGDDFIHISKTYKRPISVGIFGHPSHDLSNFKLRVYQVPYYESHVNYEYEFMDKDRPPSSDDSDVNPDIKTTNLNENSREETGSVQTSRLKKKVKSLSTKTVGTTYYKPTHACQNNKLKFCKKNGGYKERLASYLILKAARNCI